MIFKNVRKGKKSLNLLSLKSECHWTFKRHLKLRFLWAQLKTRFQVILQKLQLHFAPFHRFSPSRVNNWIPLYGFCRQKPFRYLHEKFTCGNVSDFHGTNAADHARLQVATGMSHVSPISGELCHVVHKKYVSKIFLFHTRSLCQSECPFP